jgi:tRNA nucleotidyltransferase (CCA-adding enzyme)
MKAPVRAYMTRNLLSVSPGTPLREIGQLFADHSISSLPVVEGGRLAGLVRREDYLRLMDERGLVDREFLDRLRAKSRGEQPAEGEP